MHPAILKVVPAKLTVAAGQATLQLSKQSPHILFGAGIVGFGATIYLASKAVLKLDRHVDVFQENLETVKELYDSAKDSEEGRASYPKSEYRKDLAYLYANSIYDITKMYAPTVIVGTLTIVCLTKSHTILSNRNTALMAAYSVLERSYNAYRKRVIDEFGEDKDREFRYPTKEIRTLSLDEKGKAVEKVETKTLLDQYSTYARFFDEMCPDWKRNPEYNLIFLRAQQNWANDLLRARGHVFLNEVYDMLGIPRTKAGAVVGWVIGHEGDNYIDFGLFDGENSAARDFVNGRERSILLDFNVDGVIYDKIGS
ncbi:MAG TPA: DUF6353 family protein [Fervidobacterium sp.]|nr:DUF6353 family protein [Fervidobacterium sp.]